MGTLIYVNLCYGYKLRLYRVFINMVHVMCTLYNVMRILKYKGCGQEQLKIHFCWQMERFYFDCEAKISIQATKHQRKED